MPLFIFKCQRCGKEFEKIVKPDKFKVKCSCGGIAIKDKVKSMRANFVLK